MRSFGVILLAVWLIITALIALVPLNFPQSGLLLAILALAAGILLLMDLRGGRRARVADNLGIILLAIWLILQGLLPLLNINIPNLGLLMALLALAAGVLILIRRGNL